MKATAFTCPACGYSEIREPGKIYTAQLPMHCNVLMQGKEMTKLACIDFDGPLAIIEKRLADALTDYYACVPESLSHLRTEEAARENPLYWQLVFRAEKIPGDLLFPGAPTALKMLEDRGWTVLIHTSRPDTIYKESFEWLCKHGLWNADRELLMKPAQARIGTPLLKAIQIHAKVTPETWEVLFVDDSKANREEILKHLTVPCRVAADLMEALALLTE